MEKEENNRHESFRIKKRISLSVLPSDISNLAIFCGYGSFCPSHLHLDRVFSRSQSVAFKYTPCFVMLQNNFNVISKNLNKQILKVWHSLCVIGGHV